MDVYEKINQDMQTIYSAHRYMSTDKWFDVAHELYALSVAGNHALQVTGRVDIMSLAVYGTPLLDWVLLLYNNIKHIGNDEPIVTKRTATMTLAPGESRSLHISITPDSYSILSDVGAAQKQAYLSLDVGTNVTSVQLDPDAAPGIDLTVQYVGDPTFTNVSAVSHTVTVAYNEMVVDDTLVAGQILTYPALTEVVRVLNEADRVSNNVRIGFSRL